MKAHAKVQAAKAKLAEKKLHEKAKMVATKARAGNQKFAMKSGMRGGMGGMRGGMGGGMGGCGGGMGGMGMGQPVDMNDPDIQTVMAFVKGVNML